MIAFRPSREADVPAIVALLADDPLGATREGGDVAAYLTAFRAMRESPAMHLIVGERAGAAVATYQLAILPGLSSRGQTRALLEAVRVAAPLRGQGLGRLLMADAMTRAEAAGAGIIELFTHRSRTRAHGFYEGLGFTPSHIGYKRRLTSAG